MTAILTRTRPPRIRPIAFVTLIALWGGLAHLPMALERPTTVDEFQSLIRSAGYTDGELTGLARTSSFATAGDVAYLMRGDSALTEVLDAWRTDSPHGGLLHYVLTWLVCSLVGPDVRVLRCLNLAWLTLTIAATGFLAYLLVPREEDSASSAAVCSAALVATATTITLLATDLRLYPLYMFLATATTVTFVFAIRGRTARFWALYTGAAVLTIYSCHAGVLVPVVHALSLAVSAPKLARSELRALAAAGAALIVAWLPLAYALVMGQEIVRTKLNWLASQSPTADRAFLFARLRFRIGWPFLEQHPPLPWFDAWSRPALALLGLSATLYALWWARKPRTGESVVDARRERAVRFVAPLSALVPLCVFVAADLVFKLFVARMFRYSVTSALGMMLCVALASREIWRWAGHTRHDRLSRGVCCIMFAALLSHGIGQTIAQTRIACQARATMVRDIDAIVIAEDSSTRDVLKALLQALDSPEAVPIRLATKPVLPGEFRAAFFSGFSRDALTEHYPGARIASGREGSLFLIRNGTY